MAIGDRKYPTRYGAVLGWRQDYAYAHYDKVFNTTDGLVYRAAGVVATNTPWVVDDGEGGGEGTWELVPTLPKETRFLSDGLLADTPHTFTPDPDATRYIVEMTGGGGSTASSPSASTGTAFEVCPNAGTAGYAKFEVTEIGGEVSISVGRTGYAAAAGRHSSFGDFSIVDGGYGSSYYPVASKYSRYAGADRAARAITGALVLRVIQSYSANSFTSTEDPSNVMATCALAAGASTPLCQGPRELMFARPSNQADGAYAVKGSGYGFGGEGWCRQHTTTRLSKQGGHGIVIVTEYFE